MNKEILKDISVLYVEDENDVREFTSKLLGSLLKKVYVAQNGLEGLELYKENQNDIDLIISDINMPKMNGLDMCEQIRKINNEIIFNIAFGPTFNKHLRSKHKISKLD